MNRNTIKWRIYKYNLIVIILFISITAITFNFIIDFYFENKLDNQLKSVLNDIKRGALDKGKDMVHKGGKPFPIPPKPPPDDSKSSLFKKDDSHKYFKNLDLILNQSTKFIGANYILFYDNKQVIEQPTYDNSTNFSRKESNKKIITFIRSKLDSGKTKFNYKIDGVDYRIRLKHVSNKNNFHLGWIIVYADPGELNNLIIAADLILLAILILSALLISFISSVTAKKISQPFTTLNQHLCEISDRNFNKKLHMPVDDELQDFVNNINILSEKLETYDKAQKTFLQNASHEFRTPLMSIQSYAEGIKYDVVDSKNAADIIIDESKRLTHLVEELLYLSRLDTIEENYTFENYDFSEFINNCVERMAGIAAKKNIKITINRIPQNLTVSIDEEKLSRALINVLSNCLRYAKNILALNANIIDEKNIELIISDDGPGFQDIDLENLFERFQKGKKGIFGLGLAISKNVIEKHNGSISAENSNLGAVFKIKLPIINKVSDPKTNYEFIK